MFVSVNHFHFNGHCLFYGNVDAEKWKSLKSLSFYSVVKSIECVDFSLDFHSLMFP